MLEQTSSFKIYSVPILIMEQNTQQDEIAHTPLNQNAQENLTNTGPCTIPTSKQALSDSWELYKKNWKSFTGLFLLIYAGIIPVFIVAFIVVFAFSFFHNQAPILAAIGIPLAIAAAIAVFIWAFLCSFSMVTLAIHAQEGMKAVPALRLTWRSLGKLLWTGIIYGLLVFLGYLLFIVPGIVLSIYWSFSFYVCLTENKSGYPALKRSRELIRGYVWTLIKRWVFWMYLALGFMIFSLIPLFGQIGSIIITVIYSPLGAIYFYALYKTVADRKAGGEQTDNTTAGAKIKTILFMIIPVAGLIAIMSFLIYMNIQKEKRLPTHSNPPLELQKNSDDSPV